MSVTAEALVQSRFSQFNVLDKGALGHILSPEYFSFPSSTVVQKRPLRVFTLTIHLSEGQAGEIRRRQKKSSTL
jgi:hypothetical protein